ncbi:MAG: hypothetical protein ACOY5W_00860 [Pseudomonadota bacterium]
MTDENAKPGGGDEFSQRVFDQFMDLFVVPEIRSRQEKGEAERPYELRAAQIVFYPDGRKPSVRLNSEVVAVGEARLKSGISKKAGEPIYASEIDGFDNIKLADDDCPDCGHATLIRFSPTWSIAFDFRYNKALSRRHLDTAWEFYDSAAGAAERRQWSAFVDTLFSAVELAAKALLISMPDPTLRERATHKAVIANSIDSRAWAMWTSRIAGPSTHLRIGEAVLAT